MPLNNLRKWYGLTITITLISFFSCQKDELKQLDKRVETPHFIIYYSDDTASESEIEIGLEKVEEYFQLISDYLSKKQTIPNRKLNLYLLGKNPGAPGGWVDANGDIRLHRLPAVEGGYWYAATLPHEIVHALRFDYFNANLKYTWDNMQFLDEGFAELTGLKVNPNSPSFSTFGFPLEIVAGYWLSSGRALSMQQLRDQHDDLNLKCAYQAFPQRASWISYINEVYGEEKLFDLVYTEQVPDSAFINDLFGKTWLELDAAWIDWAQNQYDNFPKKDSLENEFNLKIVQNIDFCR